MVFPGAGTVLGCSVVGLELQENVQRVTGPAVAYTLPARFPSPLGRPCAPAQRRHRGSTQQNRKVKTK